MFNFQCAKNKDHVGNIKVTIADLRGGVEFFQHFDVKLNPEVEAQIWNVIAKGHEATSAEVHDASHALIQGMLELYLAGESTMVTLEGELPGMFAEIIVKQEQCRLGTDTHE